MLSLQKNLQRVPIVVYNVLNIGGTLKLIISVIFVEKYYVKLEDVFDMI